MSGSYLTTLVLSALLVTSAEVAAQGGGRRPLFEGSAVVRVDDTEYTIPILCDDTSRPELGFTTEPNRVTRERTGRYSLIGLRVRASSEPDEVVVSLERYVAWMPRPASAGGVLSVVVDMSPASMVRDNMPVALTRDMWMNGDRPAGLEGVEFEARCDARDHEAPSSRKISGR